jgi:hypothetical protein
MVQQQSPVNPQNPFNQSNSIQAFRSASSTPLPSVNNNLEQFNYTFAFQPSVGTVIEVTMVANPEEFTQIESSTSNVVLTAGDIYSDSFGPGLTRITMSGTFGQRPIVNGSPGSGQYQVTQLRDLFRQYLDAVNPIITQDPTANSQAQLFFYNPKDNESWIIEPTNDWFILKRSKSSPFLYRYELSFTCLSKVSSIQVFDPQSIRSQTLDVLNINNQSLGTVLSNISSDTENITFMMGQLGQASNAFSTLVTAPLTNLFNAASNFLGASSQIINYQLSDIVAIKNTLQNFENTMTITYSSYLSGNNPTFIYDPVFDNYLCQSILILDKFLLYPNNFVKQFIKSDFSTQTASYDASLVYVDLNNIKSVIYIIIKSGDTLESIALATLGSTDYWKAIAEFNNLVYPFITDIFPQPEKTLSTGQQIAIPIINSGNLANNLILGSFIPNPSPGNPGVNPNANNATFGTDFYINPTGDINFVTSTTSEGVITSDIQTVSGISEFIQGIYLKINILRDELVLHKGFGMFNFTGYRESSLLVSRAKSELQNTILTDSRVKDVNISIILNSDILSYTTEIITNFQTIPITFSGNISLQGN